MKDELKEEVKQFREELREILQGINRTHISIDGTGQVLSNGEYISTYELVKRDAMTEKWLSKAFNIIIRVESSNNETS